MSSSSVKCNSMSYCYAAQSNVHLQNHLSVTAMVISAWLVEQAVTKEEWRCVSMGCGGLWAAVTGTPEKPQWCANSLDTRTRVRFVYALHILLYCYCYVCLILEAWMVKPLRSGCVNTVVACWILITSDYVNIIDPNIIDPQSARSRKLALCGLEFCFTLQMLRYKSL